MGGVCSNLASSGDRPPPASHDHLTHEKTANLPTASDVQAPNAFCSRELDPLTKREPLHPAGGLSPDPFEAWCVVLRTLSDLETPLTVCGPPQYISRRTV